MYEKCFLKLLTRCIPWLCAAHGVLPRWALQQHHGNTRLGRGQGGGVKAGEEGLGGSGGERKVSDR